MKKGRFLGSFLILFALLLGLWNLTQGTRWYTQALLGVAAVIGPLLHGWVLEYAPTGRVGLPVWVHGGDRVQAAIQFDALAVGLVPVLALIAATPGLGLRRRLTLLAVGSAICFLVDAVIVALFPLLVFYKNAFTDVIGTFLGLIAFVGAPVIIWFGLAFPELQQWLPSLRPQGPWAVGDTPPHTHKRTRVEH